MGRVITIANQQNGTGKTATSVNLAACLALLGKKVLLIDTDPQANATSSLGLVKDSGNGLYEVLKGEINAREAVNATEIAKLQMIPTDINLIGAEFDLLEHPGRNILLRSAIAPIRNEFDFIIIDCGPSLGILTLNALAAADSVLIPIQPEFFALDGIGKLLQTVRLMQSSENPGLEIEGFVITLYDGRSKMHSQVVEDIRGMFSDMVFGTVVMKNEKIREAELRNMPVVLYDPRCTGAANYTKLAQEIIDTDR